jgi:hypothetical protein
MLSPPVVQVVLLVIVPETKVTAEATSGNAIASATTVKRFLQELRAMVFMACGRVDVCNHTPSLLTMTNHVRGVAVHL